MKTFRFSAMQFAFVAIGCCGIFFGMSSEAEAANRYVRQGATGNGSGSDWTNAYATLPASLTSGDIYYLADGSYMLPSEIATTNVTIKKCSASAHGTETGYSVSNCDGQAVLNGSISPTANGLVVDGSYRNESDWSDGNAYGIRVSDVSVSTFNTAGNVCPDNITLRYLHLGGTAGNPLDSAVYMGGFHNACDSWIIGQSLLEYISHYTIIQSVRVTNSIIEYNRFQNSLGKEAIRGQLQFSGNSIRWNQFYNACGQGGGTGEGCTAEIAAWGEVGSGNWDNNKIYGNWFFLNRDENSGGSIIIGGDGIYWTGSSGNNNLVYNNSFGGYSGGNMNGFIYFPGSGSGNICRNNLWFNVGNPSANCNTTSNNVHITSNSFLDYSSGNFHLSAPTASGYALPSPYNTDPDGNLRGADGVWDIGAYEYGGSAPAPDTTPPTLPSNFNLAATATSQSSITVSWNPATDNVGVSNYQVERCTGLSCSTFTQVGTPANSPFTDSNLTASTGYSYHVRAVDAAGNTSGWSNVVGATTQSAPAPDTQAPTTPTNLQTSAISSSTINLTWTASTDNIAVTNYKVERCQGASCTTFTQIATPTTNSYQDTSLSASTTYRYRVRATDAAGNNSTYSSIAEATTQTPPPVSDSLMLGLSFNEGSGTTTQDVSGHDNTGTLQNGTAWNTTGKYGNSLTFDGVDDVVNIGNPSTLNLTSSFTLSAWIYPTNLSGDRDIITKVNGSSDYHLQITGNAVQVGFSNGGWYSATTTTNTVPLNAWTHVAGVFNNASNTLTVYIGGTQSAQTTNVTAIPQSTSNPVHVGMGWSGQNWNGRIDDVRIYNTALTQQEIQTDMNTPLSTGGSSPTPTACSLLTTPTLWNSDPNHASFGTPYDLFDSNNLTVKADCTSGSPTTMNLSIGKVNDSQLFSLMQGYYWNGTDWTSYTLNTCSGNQTGSWCQGTSSGTITNANINTGDQLNPQYFLGLTCRYTGSLPWKCGCQDSSCATPSWQLQGAGL